MGGTIKLNYALTMVQSRYPLFSFFVIGGLEGRVVFHVTSSRRRGSNPQTTKSKPPTQVT